MNIENNILSRYKKYGRQLPWRQTKDPYAIHISEVMLQQTQVDRVIPYFYQWIKDFPNYQALAKASKIELLQHWSGLWFNSRALRLQACAQQVVERYDGKLPQDRNQLLNLSWIWPYTSAAIMAFAWNIKVAVIDTNIRRVLIFLYQLPESISMQDLEACSQKLLFLTENLVIGIMLLMDYGALELTARKTKIKPLSKQSKFEWSDRQVRGWILKHNALWISFFCNDFIISFLKTFIHFWLLDSLVIESL
jgi:A/G-specific adenine glycosylase